MYSIDFSSEWSLQSFSPVIHLFLPTFTGFFVVKASSTIVPRCSPTNVVVVPDMKIYIKCFILINLVIF